MQNVAQFRRSRGIRRNDLFNRSDTRARVTERDIERMQKYERAANTSQMKELSRALCNDAMVAHMSDEQMGVTYTSIPLVSSAAARGKTARTSAPSVPKPAIPKTP